MRLIPARDATTAVWVSRSTGGSHLGQWRTTMPHASTAAPSRHRDRAFEQVRTQTRVSLRGAGWTLCVGLACMTVACGGESSGSTPTAPSPAAPSATAVNVTVKSPVRMGESAQATGAATLGNGQPQNVVSGWQSDAPGVATVTDAGMVTGVANGRATIYVVTGGRQGQQVIRVVPDYQGQWTGTLRVASCTQTGVFVEVDLCKELPVNSTEGFDLGFTQDGENVNARMFFGENGSQTVAAPIAPDGSAAFSGSTTFTDEGITLALETTWQVNSTRVGALTGRVTDVYRFTGFPGEGRLSYDIASASRGSTSAGTLRTGGGRWSRVPRRLGQPLRR